MKLKSVLLASVAVLFAGSASAADLTNPFYLPSQGQFTSDTQIGYGRTEFSGEGNYDSVRATEEITYGVSDNLSVFGVLGNDFDVEGEYNNSHNFDYEIGAKYNKDFGKVKTQVAASYYTYDPESFVGHRNNDHEDKWQKYVNGAVKVGYDMGNGVTPYASYALNGQVDSADREMIQSAFAGVHKFGGNWAVDGGLRYDFNTDGQNSNLVYVQAAADYYPTEKLVVGAFGDYNIGGHADDVDEEYTLGLRAKVLF